MSRLDKVESLSNRTISLFAIVKEFRSLKSKMYSIFIMIFKFSGVSTSMTLGWLGILNDRKEMDL